MTSFAVPGVGTLEASPSRMSRALARNANRENLIWYGLDTHTLSAALGDRIVVRRDRVESEYSCRDCKGRGHTDARCGLCEGKGDGCTNCRVLGYTRSQQWSSGYLKCAACSGSGWRGGVIVPDTAQAAPVTGTVVSLGPACTLLKLGDRVLHSKFSGHTLEMKAESYTYMREVEAISILRDL